MKKIYKVLIAIAMVGLSNSALQAQCINSSQYPSGTVTINATTGSTTNITGCNFGGEYSVNSFTATGNYSVTSSIATDFITVTDNSNNVLISGNVPLAITIPSVGVYYIHVSTNSSCGTDATCHSIAVVKPQAPCSAMPASTVIAASASLCPGNSTSFSLNTAYSGTGVSYQWFTSTSGSSGPYTSVPSATSPTFSSSFSTSTWIMATITCSNGPLTVTATPVQVTVTPGTPCSCLAYCSSSATSTFDEEIFNVSIGTLNNTSTCSQTGGPGSVLNQYSNYSGMITAPSLTAGSSYVLSVTAGECSGNSYSAIVGVYMDFNQNGSFTDPGENVYTSTYGSIAVAGTTFTSNITIPLAATPGITRMRVVVNESSVVNPCNSYSWGETEDYCIDISAAAACSGAPGANSVVASSTVVCPGGTANLSLANSYTVGGLTYQWSSAPSSSGPYTTIPGATQSTYSAPNITSTTWFQAVITCTNGSVSTTATAVQINAGGNPCLCTAYCASSATSTFDDEIFNVTIGSLNNTSTCGQTGGPGSVQNQYSNYAGMIAAPTLVGGISYPLSVTVGMCNNFAYSGVVTVYIDYNQNGSFTDPGELVYTSPYTQFAVAGTAVSGNVTIPTSALPGITRMRVIEVESSTPGASCGTFSWGEVEDYCVNIVPPVPCSGTPSANSVVGNPTVVCYGGASTLSLATTYTVGGIDYQWSTATSSVGPYTAISGATVASYTDPNIIAATWYQAVATCSSSGLSATATPVQVILQTPPVYAAVPFLESFDNTWQNRCDIRNVPVTANWDDFPTTGNNSWRRQNDGASAGWTNPTSNTVAPIGTGCADFHSSQAASMTTGDLDLFVNMGGSGNYVLSFYNYNNSGSDSLLVYFSNNGGFSFSQIGSYNVATSWTKQTITLGSVASPSCIVRFRGVSDLGFSDIGVDSVSVFTATCAATPSVGSIAGPNNVNIGTTNSYSVTSSVGNLQWYQSASSSGPWSPITSATTTPVNILASTGGTVYYTVVASGVGCTSFTSSAFAVTVNPLPGDMPCSPTAITNFSSTTYYYLDNYTSQPNEVMPTGGACSTNTTWCIASVENSHWFTFVAPPSGNVSIQSPGFDTQLAVWNATNCADLTSASSSATLIAANDDDPNYTAHGGVVFSSYVTATCLNPGATYYLQLDSYSAASPFDSTLIVITDLGYNSFTGLAPAYCLPNNTTATLSPNFAGGYFTLDASTNTITAFTPSVAGVGTHTVMYTVNGCTSSSIVAVSNQPTVTASAGSGTVCAGGSTPLTANGASTYTWSTGATGNVIAVTPSTTTTFSVNGDNGAGCTGTATVNVTVNALPGVSLTAAQTTVCINGPTVGLSGSPSGGVYTGSNVTSGVFTPGSTAGTFVPGYAVTDTTTGCSNSASVAIIVSACTGINKLTDKQSAISIYPNPNTGVFVIEFDGTGSKTIEVCDLTGRIVLEEKTSLAKTTINITDLANGVYFVKVDTVYAREVIKIIKE